MQLNDSDNEDANDLYGVVFEALTPFMTQGDFNPNVPMGAMALTIANLMIAMFPPSVDDEVLETLVGNVKKALAHHRGKKSEIIKPN